MLYEASGFWNKAYECSIRWDDPDLAIAWPLEQLSIAEPLLADRDGAAPASPWRWPPEHSGAPGFRKDVSL
nr:dTDP-4-dehydrorhamnose 3,5-epimerase family protein [Cyanobium usitatum]